MKRKYILQMGTLVVLGVGVLFSLVAFDQPGFSRDRELLELSVIIRESDSSGWVAARQGMDQAAFDLGAELRFLALDQANHAQEQQALFLRELDGGADGIILVPADPALLAADVRQAAGRAAVVTMESDMSDSGADTCITVDNGAVGRALGQAAINGVPPGGRVVLLDSAADSTGIQERLSQAWRALRERGRQAEILHLSESGDALDFGPDPPDAVIAFEPAVLELAARKLRGMEKPPLLYGMGATNVVVSGLERGDIVAIAAQNEFAAGYLAVEAAVRAARGRFRAKIDPIPFAMVRQENMYEADRQKLLFPVTR